MKKFIMAAICVLNFAGNAGAAPLDAEMKDSLADGLAGNYQLIGKDVAGKLYEGTVTLVKDGDKIKVAKNIGQKHFRGTAEIIDDTPDKIPLLCFTYKVREGCYLWRFDMDNYPILVNASSPGTHEKRETSYEAMFYKIN